MTPLFFIVLLIGLVTTAYIKVCVDRMFFHSSAHNNGMSADKFLFKLLWSFPWTQMKMLDGIKTSETAHVIQKLKPVLVAQFGFGLLLMVCLFLNPHLFLKLR